MAGGAPIEGSGEPARLQLVRGHIGCDNRQAHAKRGNRAALLSHELDGLEQKAIGTTHRCIYQFLLVQGDS